VLFSFLASVRTTRSFRSDVPLCPEVSNCSRLHLSRRFSNLFGRLSVFDKSKDFFPKHKYGKIVATVRTTWLFRSDAILDKASHTEDVQLSERQTPWTLGQHHSDAALFRKEFQANLESRLHSCPSRHPQLPSECDLGKSYQT
jgi:hypothetical protein